MTKKMNLREFAEVLMVCVNRLGVNCHIDKSAPDRQLRLAADKGNVVVSTSISSIWNQCNDTDADMQQVAQAVAQAMADALEKAPENTSTPESSMDKAMKVNDATDEDETDVKLVSAKDWLNTMFGTGSTAESTSKTEEPNTDNKRQYGPVIRNTPNKDSAVAPAPGQTSKQQHCNCSGNCSGKCSNHSHDLSHDYDPMKELPEELCHILEKVIAEAASRYGEYPNMEEPDEVFKAEVLDSVIPMFISKAELQTSPGILYREPLPNMHIAYYIVSGSAVGVLKTSILEALNMSEDEVFNASIKNLGKKASYKFIKQPLGNRLVDLAILFANDKSVIGENGAISMLADGVLYAIAQKMREENLLVAPLTDKFSVAYPASKVNAYALTKAIQNTNGTATDKLYVYCSTDDSLSPIF